MSVPVTGGVIVVWLLFPVVGLLIKAGVYINVGELIPLNPQFPAPELGNSVEDVSSSCCSRYSALLETLVIGIGGSLGGVGVCIGPLLLFISSFLRYILSQVLASA